MQRTLAVLLVLATHATTAAAQQPVTDAALATIDTGDLHAHTAFLASDLLRGRAPATHGARVAAAYIASQLVRAGLEPAGGSYFQQVQLIGATVDPVSFALGFESDERRIDARYAEDAVVWPGGENPAVQVGAELVFVGYGVRASEFAWDDYKDRDLNGKVLLMLVGDPPAPPEEPDLFGGRAMTYYGRWTYKFEEAARQGAAGALLIHTPDAAGYDWGVVRSSFTGEQLDLVPAPGEPGLALKGWIGYEFAREILASAGTSLDELYVRAARRDFRPASTGLSVRTRLNARIRRLESANVVGLLRGASRPEEVVVVTAHYDHLGVGPPVDDDSIYNGAYDNAIGVATLLELAEATASLAPRPDRSVLFIATTAEEAGLLGAEHYVRQPIMPLEQTVACLNIDGASLWGETDDMTLIGASRSPLAAMAMARADQLGLQLIPDPTPEKGYFFRSDLFPFAEHGVPAIHIEHGSAFRGRPPGWGTDLLRSFEAQHYHEPSDAYSPDMDLSGAAQLARLVFLTTLDAATLDTP